MPKFLGALIALALLSPTQQANAIMAIKKFSIDPTKSTLTFTDKASNREETFAGTAVGKIHEMKSADGAKHSRMRVYKMKAGDFAAVEMHGYSTKEDGLYLLKATNDGTESIKIEDRSIKTIEALEANVLHPAKAQGLKVGDVYSSLQQNEAKLIFVDDSGDSYDEEPLPPPQDYDQDYDQDYEEDVPMDEGGYYERDEQFYARGGVRRGGCMQGPCGGGFVIVRPVPVFPVFPMPPVCGGWCPPPPPCFNGCGGGFQPPFVQPW